jgi:hypothetical protein
MRFLERGGGSGEKMCKLRECIPILYVSPRPYRRGYQGAMNSQCILVGCSY